ncbi:MAG: hypothetical protein ED557_12950 [Balneola sp.]|nr:MAG: hypothetical protein ED557_12950 [Balneola sp.]
MRKFLRKLAIFTLFPVLYFGINIAANWYLHSNQPVPVENVSVLIVGDSHTQRSLNPEYFNSSINISQTAEPYVLTYWKLKKIFNSFTPDTLILGFAPHNISGFNDLKFSNERWSDEMFRRSYSISEFDQISNTIPVDYKAFYKVVWKQTAFYPKKNHVNYIGGYTNNKTNIISDWEATIERHYYYDGIELGISETSINYLDLIIELCVSKNIEIVLVSNPVHINYLENIPPAAMQRFNALAERYSKKHIVFDQTTAMYEDSLFLNSDHLNELGARRFTKELLNYLSDK